MAKKLVQDLAHINSLIGPMKPTPDFISAWETWQPTFDQYLIDLKSERLEAIMSRKGTNLIKVAMLLSISEGDSLVLTGDHFRRALEIIEDVYKDNPKIIAFAAMSDLESQKGASQFILRSVEKNGGTMPKKSIIGSIMSHGNDITKAEAIFNGMISAGWVSLSPDGVVNLITLPDSHL
jgi:hypothetical protein